MEPEDEAPSHPEPAPERTPPADPQRAVESARGETGRRDLADDIESGGP